jgi:hypothetical protein
VSGMNLTGGQQRWRHAGGRSAEERRRAKERERLTIPAAPDQLARLAPHYRNAALGDIDVIRQPGSTAFDFGEYKSAIASRHNDDGTTSFIPITPVLEGSNSWWAAEPANPY